jgi:hypothetical protein
MSERKWEWRGEKEFAGENFREKEARRETKKSRSGSVGRNKN